MKFIKLGFINHFVYLFRKHPLFRTVVYGIAIVLFFIVSLWFSLAKTTEPTIDAISPPAGSGGDVLTISGKHFGNAQQNGYVEIGGSRVTASGYLSWTDTTIRLVVPQNARDGLVSVTTGAGLSNPKVFANIANIPVEVSQNKPSSLPLISALSSTVVSPGQLLIISGSNFGAAQGNSAVLFTAAYSKTREIDVEFISCANANFDYEFWSESEIRVRVPDGAATGLMAVETSKGTSGYRRITVSPPAGTKQFLDKRIYLLQVAVELSNVAAKTDDSTIVLRIPRPPVSVSSAQTDVKLTESAPEPFNVDFNNMVIHQIAANAQGNKKTVFNHLFVVSSYSVATTIDETKIAPFSERTRALYVANTASDALVPSNDERIQTLAASVVKNETNPYRAARLLYNYLIETYSLIPNKDGRKAPLGTMLFAKRGDSYDFALLFCALARSLGIPAVPVAGVVVDASADTPTIQTKNHWWCEIYLENFGWIPVDPAFGTGTIYATGHRHDNPKEYYFGNLDSCHIVFSRGLRTVKPMLTNGKTTLRPYSFAFQSIWEEASAGVTRYDAVWRTPEILGMY